jgi:SPP1 family predicted phage head-tail adaptor
VTIQTLSTNQAADGEEVASWATTTTTWGNVSDQLASTGESFAQAAEQVQSAIYVHVRLRYRTLSPATNRLLVDNDTYEILAAMDQDGRRKELVVLCRKVEH